MTIMIIIISIINLMIMIKRLIIRIRFRVYWWLSY